MNKHHLHNTIIEMKLQQLPVADADHLWNDMHKILDEKMPQKKERRRFIVWFLSGRGLMLLSFGILIITDFSLYFLSEKTSFVVTSETSADSQQNIKLIENDKVKVLQGSRERIATTSEVNQKTKDNKTATVLSTEGGDLVTKNNFITDQTEKRSKKYKAKDQINQSEQAVSNASENFESTPLYLESIHQGPLVNANFSEEKKYISPQLKPVTDKVIKLKPGNNNESGFYAGIMSGVDLSAIRFKSVKTGANKGFILGYAFNKKWSIESGLFWDTKRVYDNGSYFTPPGYTPTSGITIIAVNGKSRLLELPVNVKYTIISGKHNLFATTGLSSYFMRSENYEYEYLQNSQPGGHNYLSYKNETQDWFSVANISVGYTHKLGEMGSIRVEPYLKLPLKNLGIGNMPIMSTGLNIGFIKKLK